MEIKVKDLGSDEEKSVSQKEQEVLDKAVEKETGMNTLQYVTEKTMDSEIRECETIHSAEINQIFFETLDVIDCKIYK